MKIPGYADETLIAANLNTFQPFIILRVSNIIYLFFGLPTHVT